MAGADGSLAYIRLRSLSGGFAEGSGIQRVGQRLLGGHNRDEAVARPDLRALLKGRAFPIGRNDQRKMGFFNRCEECPLNVIRIEFEGIKDGL